MDQKEFRDKMNEIVKCTNIAVANTLAKGQQDLNDLMEKFLGKFLTNIRVSN